MQKCCLSFTLIIGASCLFKLLLNKTDSNCISVAVTHTRKIVWCLPQGAPSGEHILYGALKLSSILLRAQFERPI